MKIEHFVAETKIALDKFEASWRLKNAQSPEMYPLELPANNAGLWLELFIMEQEK